MTSGKAKDLEELIEFEVVKTLYLQEIEIVDAREEPIKLRLEVLKSWTKDTYHVRLYRLETYSLCATFGSKEVWGKEILVRDGFTDWDEISGDSVESVIETVLKLLPY